MHPLDHNHLGTDLDGRQGSSPHGKHARKVGGATAKWNLTRGASADAPMTGGATPNLLEGVPTCHRVMLHHLVNFGTSVLSVVGPWIHVK